MATCSRMIALPASGMVQIPCSASAWISVLFPEPGPPVITNRRSESIASASIPPPDADERVRAMLAQYCLWMASRNSNGTHYRISNDADDRGFKHFAVGAQYEHLVAAEAYRDRNARAEFARHVAVGRLLVVLADILPAVHSNHDRFAGRRLCGFAPDFLFGLSPVVHIAARSSSVADVNLLGALTDSLFEVVRRLWPGLRTLSSDVHESIPLVDDFASGSFVLPRNSIT